MKGDRSARGKDSRKVEDFGSAKNGGDRAWEKQRKGTIKIKRK